MPAPKSFIPAGYQPELDRLPARQGPGCAPLIRLAFVVIALIGGGIMLLLNFLNGQQRVESIPQAQTNVATLTPTAITSPTPAPTNTLDPWSATGTALVYQPPTATADYCWFLTPSPTPTAVILTKPDAWSATGTAIWHRENPPTPIVSPTATTPRSWCDYETATPTPTAFILDRSGTVTPSQTPTAMPTRTPYPIAPQPQTGGGNIPVPPTEIPIVIIPTSIPPTLAPPTIRPTKHKKTRTPTMTPTFTETPTLTPSATNVPVLNVLFSDCAAGYPTVIVQAVGNFPTSLQWQLVYTTSDGTPPIAAVGEWLPSDIIPPNAGIAAAPMWSGIAGTYSLMVDGLHVYGVVCEVSATLTPTATLTATEITPEPTLEPVSTETPEGTS